MNRVDIKSEFSELFPWHCSPLSKGTDDCPHLGNIEFDYAGLTNFVLEMCEKQDPKTSGRGWSTYYQNEKLNHDKIKNRDIRFKKLFDTWIKSNWTMENSCFYEFHDEELGDFYQPLMEAYKNKFGEISQSQLRLYVKPPMTALGLHADTFGSYQKQHITEQSVFRALTFIEDWEWGHYTLIGNEVCHQYKAGDTVQIKPNVLHCVGNMGFNPQITMNITGVRDADKV